MATQIFTSKDMLLDKREVFASAPLSGAITLTPSSEPVTHDFLGFGVAITGSSCYLLSKMKKEERAVLLRDLYTPSGLDLSVARITIGASDYSAELYTYEDTRGQFSIEKDEAYVIPMIKEILAIKPELYIYASPWSPPAWMKTGGSIGGGYMRAEFIEDYADYTVKFLRAYEERGIHISALTPQNEPETHQQGKMTACIWHPEIEAEYIKVLRRKLDENGMKVRIWMHDHNFEYTPRVLWELDSVEGLAEAVDGVAFHYYGGYVEQTKAITAKYPSLELHFSEGGPRLYDHYGEDWCKWGIMISRALGCGYRSFMGWNLMLDQNGGPNVGPFFCGGLVTRHSESGALSYSGQYKAFRHISPYINRGSRIYSLFGDEGDCMFGYPKEQVRPAYGLMVENEGERVLILANGSSDKKQTQIFLDGKCYYIELLPDTLSTVIM